MTIPSHGKQSRLSPPRKVPPCGQIRFPLLSKTIDNAERSAKLPRSPYMMSISSHEDSCSSWEARVLAEDASVQLAAGMWPPPAYPCSFCGREFRSAQALGGHMNVHRHDRARLHCLSPPLPSHGFSLLATSPSLLPNYKYLANLFAEYTNETLMELKIPPIPLSDRNNLPAAMPYTSPSAGCPSDSSTSLPLRLQQLASEGAASLLQYPHVQQRCTSSDLLSFVSPPIANCITVACHSSKPRAIMKKKLTGTVTLPTSIPSPPSSNAISCTSLSSVIDATSREKGFSIFESSFTENDQNHLFRQIITDNKSSEEALNAPDAPKAYTQPDRNSSCMKWTKKAYTYACGNPSGADVDLELRLGRKLP